MVIAAWFDSRLTTHDDRPVYAISTTLGFRIAISRLDWALESMITDNEMRGCAEMLVRSAESVRHDRKNVGRRSILHVVIELALQCLHVDMTRGTRLARVVAAV